MADVAVKADGRVRAVRSLLQGVGVLVVLSFAACASETDNDGPFPAEGRSDRGPEGLAALRREVRQGISTFEQLRAQHADSYTYEAEFRSFTGQTCTTTVSVERGVVIKRVQALTSSRPSAASAEQLAASNWVEVAGEVGSHQGCHPPLALPELYEQCLEVTLEQDPKQNLLYVSADARGIPFLCVFVPLNCADDCAVGLNLKSVTFAGG